ncbi:MAG: tRNA(Ile)-lysidine synthase [Candidatus Binatia bacterium]|nr:MAG: tRNA(Ile)-lysidine synthase [Candidatus Binatia bacterium]
MRLLPVWPVFALSKFLAVKPASARVRGQMVAKRNWFLRKVWRTLHRYEMLEAGDRVVVAVSGGADSVALLVALAALKETLGLRLVVAHLNHQLRPAADEDELFVQNLAERLGVTVTCRRLAPGDLRPPGVEAQARALRYAYFREVAQEFGCTKVATGHTLDDQAETILMRLLRGSGLWGLRGILAVRSDGVIRPLLQCSRAEARQFLRELDVPWREDETNKDPRFLRNFVRASLMPKLSEAHPSFREKLASLAELAQEDLAAYECLIAEKLREVAGEGGSLDLERLKTLPSKVRQPVLRRWLEERCGQLAEAEFVRHLNRRLDLGASFAVKLPLRGDRKLVVSARGNRMVCGPARSDPFHWDPVPLHAPSVCELPGGWRLQTSWYSSPEAPSVLRELTAGEMNAVVDVDLLCSGLCVRPTQPGDELLPLGLGGRKKLQDIFTDRRVPRSERWGRPAVVDGDVIVWVPGVVRAEHALVRPQSRSLWLLRAAQQRGGKDEA